MRSNSFTVIAFLLTLLSVQPAQAHSISDLPVLLEQLSSEDSDKIIETLDVLGRICDETCFPYIRDMLHHHQMEVVVAACKTASQLANPAFSPALLELVRHFPAEPVKFEAIKALSAIGMAYDAMLLNVNPEKLDETQRQIVRNLPAHLCESKAPVFAEFAGYHALSSSIAKAYQPHPEPLIAELLTRIPAAPKETKQNMFRTMRMLIENTHGKGISESQAAIFNDEAADHWEVIAQIQAQRSTPDAVRWLVLHFSSFDEPLLMDIMRRLHGDGGAQFADAILQSAPPYLPAIIDSNQALKTIFVSLLTPTNKSLKFALSLRNTPYHKAVLHLLAETEGFSLIDELSNTSNANVAFRIITQSPNYLQVVAERAAKPSKLDNYNQAFLAQWAFILLKTNYPDIQIASDTRNALLWTARELVRKKNKLHTEPALWILHLLGESPEPPEPEMFSYTRSDVQRAWLRILKPNVALPYLKAALTDKDVSTIALALEYLSKHPELAEKIPEFDRKLEGFIQSEHAILSVQASATAAMLGKTRFIPVLQNMLTSLDTRIAYNALWALQKLHALPNEHWLKSLYFRAPEGVLKERLGFLTRLDPNAPEFFQMTELKTLRSLKKGQIVQFSTSDEPMSHQDITVILDDQSLRIYRSNGFGMIFL